MEEAIMTILFIIVSCPFWIPFVMLLVAIYKWAKDYVNE